MANDKSLSTEHTVCFQANVGLREEHFGSIIYRTGRFDFMEVNHFGTLLCRLIQQYPTSIDHLARLIADDYGRSFSEVQQDVNMFFGNPHMREFIGTDDTPPTPILQETYGEVVKNLENSWDSLPEQGYYSSPLQFHWEITRKCNLRCMHCYASASSVMDDVIDTLDWEKCVSLLDILLDMKVVQINFLGGEPLIEQHFMPLLEKAAEYGFDVTFPSNGLLFTRENLHRMKAIGMEFITISLDSADPVVFEELRGMKGIFPKVIENIKLAREMGMGVIINTVLTKTTLDGFEDLIELLIDLDVDILKVIDEFPVGRGLANMDKLLLSPRDYREFYVRMISDIEPRYRDRLEIQLSPRFAVRQELEDQKSMPSCDRSALSFDYRCSAGRSQCFCTADWDIYPCYLFYGEKEFIVGNVLDRSFKDIWRDPESFKCFRVKMGTIPECEKCDYAESCKGGCRGDAYRFTNDFFAGNPYCWNLNTGD